MWTADHERERCSLALLSRSTKRFVHEPRPDALAPSLQLDGKRREQKDRSPRGWGGEEDSRQHDQLTGHERP